VPTDSDPKPSTGAGLGFALGASLFWGGMPLFFLLLVPSGPIEIVAWRILLSLVFCAILITVTRGWARLRAIVANRRSTLLLGLAGFLVMINWIVYVYASINGHVVEAALGYFINPIFTVLLGVVVLREKLRPLQWISIGISVAAVLVIVISLGQFPWISLLLAASFGTYGLVKKGLGGSVDAISGLTLETAWLAPLATIAIVVIAASGSLTMGTISVGHTLLLLSAGIITAVPLLLFASATRRLPLSYVGLTQYLTPILQFIVGVVLLHEAMPPARWVGFGLVWVALIVLTVDMLAAGRAPRRAALEPA
jgi:chloramphenicol-sensitive protein RarD